MKWFIYKKFKREKKMSIDQKVPKPEESSIQH
jgi:hypothetical protein